MLKTKTIAISDCDHLNMNEEEAVCARFGLRLNLFQCRTEDDLIRTLPGYTAALNQYAPFMGTSFFCPSRPKTDCAVWCRCEQH